MDSKHRESAHLPIISQTVEIQAPLFWVIVGLALLNVIAPIIIDTFASGDGPEILLMIVIGLTSGCVLGQLVLLALWGALGAEPFTKRVPRCLSLLVWGCLAWILGFKVVDDIPVFVSAIFLIIAMCGVLLVMTPLLIVRHFKYWTIHHPSKPITDERSQFQIRDILVWTAIIAAQVSLAKFVTDTEQTVGPPPANFILQLTLLLLVCSAAVTCVGLPSALAILGAQSREKLAYVIGLAIVFGPTLVIEAISFSVGSRPPADDYFIVQAGFCSAGIGILTVVATVLSVVRAYGYRIGVRDCEDVRNVEPTTEISSADQLNAKGLQDA